jgi:hypothetical protein
VSSKVKPIRRSVLVRLDFQASIFALPLDLVLIFSPQIEPNTHRVAPKTLARAFCGDAPEPPETPEKSPLSPTTTSNLVNPKRPDSSSWNSRGQMDLIEHIGKLLYLFSVMPVVLKEKLNQAAFSALVLTRTWILSHFRGPYATCSYIALSRDVRWSIPPSHLTIRE